MMYRPLLLAALLIALGMADTSLAQTEPTHVCPHFIYGQTEQPDGGTIYHWYSEYLHVDGEECTSLEWNSYDGPEGLSTGGGCGNLGSCIESPFLADTKKPIRAAKEIAQKGLSGAPVPGHEPTLSPAATVVDKKIVDVMITQSKVIKVKLYLIMIDPRIIGKPLPPIFVANGFEVQYDSNYPPYMTVPHRDVTPAGGANLYEIKIGQVQYRVLTHEEG